jgi:surfeit locus 1 family protein
MSIAKKLFSRQWIIVTILVAAASMVMVRLGFWQLDRLEGRRGFNAQVLAQAEMAPLLIDRHSLEANLVESEFRKVKLVGEYAYQNEFVVGNQTYRDQIGVRLLTPLKISGATQAILVDRGWVPLADYADGKMEQYQQPGEIQIEGVLRSSQEQMGLKDCLDTSGSSDPKLIWCVNVEGVQAKLPYAVAPAVYVWRTPVGEQTTPPLTSELSIEISEGNHLSYAVQWFTFAAMLFFGYPFFVERESLARQRRQAEIQPVREAVEELR